MEKASVWFGVIGIAKFIHEILVPFTLYISPFICFVGLVLGIIAIVREEDKKIAILGTIISGVSLLFILVYLLVCALKGIPL